MLHDEMRQIVKYFYPALVLERFFSHSLRLKIKKLIAYSLFVLVLVYLVLTVLMSGFYQGDMFFGVSLMLFSVWLVLFALDAFYYSYFLDIEDRFDKKPKNTIGIPNAKYEVAQILFSMKGNDPIEGFLNSVYGRQILLRSSITQQKINDFLNERTSLLIATLTIAGGGKVRTLTEFALHAVRQDSEFKEFLLAHEITEDDFLASANWVERQILRRKSKIRWWSRENLKARRPIAEQIAYGETFILERYSHDISRESVYWTTNDNSDFGKDELQLLENILARSHEANALLIGDKGVGKMDIISRLARRIEDGNVLPALTHKKVIVFDNENMIAMNGSKSAFELELIELLNQTIKAGNIIIIFKDFASFVSSAKEMGVDILSLMDPFLSSDSLQIIATSSSDEYYSVLGGSGGIAQRFEEIMVKDINMETTVRVLEDRAILTETENDIFFTYPALKTIAFSAYHHFTSGAMPERAIDLMVEIIPSALKNETAFITKKMVEDMVTHKTGIPMGSVAPREKEKLNNLEMQLHKRVIGQDMAIKAVSNALRRSRSGTGNPDKPIGSYLFLGPTGVGKTETAKALAEVYFDTEAKLMRLDMSEYNTADAVKRLIGSFDAGGTGILSEMLHESPYGVLLLDEFEKTSKEVHDLFLQIFDEGFFSDMRGKRVYTTNIIFIATSNAGSDIIWQSANDGDFSGIEPKKLINEIINKGVFKPELLNRFDEVIVFTPLDEQQLREIARKMLVALQKRLKQKGINLEITDDIINITVLQGYDPKFGARPMKRAIQDTIEQVIARGIINGTIKSGSKVSLTREDIASELGSAINTTNS